MYLKLMIFLMMFILIYFLMIMFSFLIIKEKINIMKKNPFESGFDFMSKKNLNFSNQFFMIMLIFILFDLEILFLFILNFKSLINFFLLFFIFIIIFLSLIYEWKMKKIFWNK